ncbi:hypothetical protein DPSP01_013516 [Paraphaeosphaeria sporulosa]|uniref:Uncharacterized protein n=1 Tax=Paraphaeosphaeria sporulosa TaxID=1460663 RepID=A0A177CM53_9PLEO|nr:uncharacterized protein CC84DRAFT_1214505 [Paraphaeosphaeria sporulosa]OAG07948.1 hypothetical protein CC84DRAFT_1214505 [Paraphaeosphaeria sporulosa]
MAHKDLLKKAFRNNFIRKSVADLKSLGAKEAHPKPRHTSSTNLFSRTENDVPDLPTPPMSTEDSDAQKVTEHEHKTDDSASSLVAASEAAKPSRENVAEWLQTVPKDPATMSSTEIRVEMEKADADRKAQILRSHEQLLRDHRDLVVASEKMIVSHLDTIETAFALLEIMDALSSHAEPMRREMLEKKQFCEKKLIDLSPVRSRLETLRAGKGYICLDAD